MMNCESCPVKDLCQKYSHCQFEQQDLYKAIAVVAPSPSTSEVVKRVPFTTKHLYTFMHMASSYGFDRRSMYLTYAVKAPLDFDDSNAEKAMKACRDNLLVELNLLDNLQVIITLGAMATKALLGNVKITKVMNIPQPYELPSGKKVFVLPIQHPGMGYYNPTVYNDIEDGLLTLKHLLYKGGISDIAFPLCIQIEDEVTLKNAINALQKETIVGCDVESYGEGDRGGLRIYDPSFHILTVAVYAPSTNTAFWINVKFDDDGKPELAKHLLESVKDRCVFHNRSFDVSAIQRCLGVRDMKGTDTLLMSFVYNENIPHSLENLASKFLRWYNYKLDRTDMRTYKVHEVGEYNCKDAAATCHLYDYLKDALSDKEHNLISWLLSIQDTYMEATLNGFSVDFEYLSELKEEYSLKIKEGEAQFQTLPKVMEARKLLRKLLQDKEAFLTLTKTGKLKFTIKEFDESTELPELNTNSARQVSVLLYVLGLLQDVNNLSFTDTGSISTGKKTLSMFAEDSDEIKELLELRTLTKTYDSFIIGITREVYADGKVHPSFSLTQTATGRTASSNVNIQNQPRDNKIKDMYYSPAGWSLVQWDFAQAEIRVLASLANDRNLAEAINSGVDIHRKVASLMFDIPVEDIAKESPERQAAKACSFGIVYGISAKALARQINTTEQDAQYKMNKFLDQFPQVEQWIKKIHNQVKDKGFVTTPVFHRKRRLPEIWGNDSMRINGALRKAQNAPVQAMASDLNLFLLRKVNDNVNKEKALVLATVHDSGVFLVHDSYVKEFCQILNKSLDSLNKRFETILNVPMKIDVKVGTRWGSLEDYKEELENEL